jgi:hypothetical protein
MRTIKKYSSATGAASQLCANSAAEHSARAGSSAPPDGDRRLRPVHGTRRHIAGSPRSEGMLRVIDQRRHHLLSRE